MKNINFTNKKIGIWGFGIVGKSALNYSQKFTTHIQILDKNKQNHPKWIEQNELSIQNFLKWNDYIITSPGIKLHEYKKYQHKFITELDIYQQQYSGNTIAITGTLGKTSITTLLQQCTSNSVAAGNIGHAMLNVVTKQSQPSNVILELSSFQLQYAQKFSPNLSIWTNFYQNHLDHHKSEQEYFVAKCNILKHQTSDQTTLLPCNLIDSITKQITINAQQYLFCSQLCSKQHTYPSFQIKNNDVVLIQQNNERIIFKNINQLSTCTFQENWLIIIAALHLQNIPVDNVIAISKQQPAQEHRLEYLGTINGTTFYNDSKSTVWQATKQALETLDNQPCALLLGGLSKGADRTPLIKYLTNKNVIVFAFGHEAEHIQNLCKQFNVPCSSYSTLTQAFEQCLKFKQFKAVLLSPAGASFDLFKNYQDRGQFFKKLVKNIANIED